jgi:AGZA family xanthine/uracil permease-like MFS transporter
MAFRITLSRGRVYSTPKNEQDPETAFQLMRSSSVLERWFKLAENRTTVRQEMLGGLTTFVTMAYIIVVNPRILAEAGMPIEGVLFATCVSAAVATLVMGLWANYPIALAPGMSLNAYFTYSVVIGRGIPWQTALGVVFLSGLLFLVLTLTRVREQIVNGIPDCLKFSTAAGIGLFIAFIGLRNAKMVVAQPATFLGLGSFSDPQVQIAAFGLILTAILVTRRAGGAILIGIVITTFAGILRGLQQWPLHFISLPHPASTLFKFDLSAAMRIGLLEMVFAFFFVDLFDNVGTLVGVCEQAGFMRDGKLPRASRALLADAVGTVFGATVGTSTVTSYIESAAGVAAGARTGLGNVLIAALFLVALFFSPLVGAIPLYATAPALILVGALMCRSVARVEWNDFSEAFPAFLTLVAIPFTFSVATGLSLGLIAYALVKLGSGKYREISPLIWILTVLFVLRYAYLSFK